MKIEERERQLNEMVLSGQILEAFDRFYADDIVMQENSEPATVGKAENRKREQAFLDSVQEFHGARLLGSAVSGNRSFSEWELDVTFHGGARVLLSQIAARTWTNGQVSAERFYYNKS